MPNEIIPATPSMGAGEVLRAYDPEPVQPEAAQPAADPTPTTEVEATTTDETSETQESESPTLPPDLEEMRKNLLRDYHGKTQSLADRARAVEARQQELAAREAALQQRLAQYEVYDEFGRIVEADPELQELVASRIPQARGRLNRVPSDADAAGTAAIQRQLAEVQIDQVETAMASAHPDWAEHAAEVQAMLFQTNALAAVNGPKQLRAVYDMAYRAVAGGQSKQAVTAKAQKELVGQVKKAAQAARVGGSAPLPAPEPELSSFDQHGRLRKWDDIISGSKPHGR